MSCAETLRTWAFVDGEAAGAEAEATRRHIEGCADCQALVADAAALSQTIRAGAPRHTAPALLRRRVTAMLDEEETRTPSPARSGDSHRSQLIHETPLPQGEGGARPRSGWEGEGFRSRRIVRTPSSSHASSGAGPSFSPWEKGGWGDLKRAPPGFWRGAFSGVGVTALAAGLAALVLLPPAAVTLADQVTAAHTAALMGGREIQVVSTDHHTVKPWFAGRLALSPPVADFGAQGYRLIGGRLDKVAGARAAVVVYQHGKHEIDLFVWADRGSALPAAGLSHGYHSMFWKSRDLDFAAVSDTAAPELASFVQLVRGEPE